MVATCIYCGKRTAERVDIYIEEERIVEIAYHCSNCNRNFTDQYEYENTVDENDEIIYISEIDLT